MNWQSFKEKGEHIYVMRKVDNEIYLKREQRVIHYRGSLIIDTERCVRFASRWYPLHEPKELKTRYKQDDGSLAKVYLDYSPLKSTDPKLPFIRTWEDTGGLYHVFGY